MESLSPWHYILIGTMILNLGITIGGFIMLVMNHIKHINEALVRIERKTWKNDEKIDEHSERIARLEGRDD